MEYKRKNKTIGMGKPTSDNLPPKTAYSQNAYPRENFTEKLVTRKQDEPDLSRRYGK